MMVSSIKNRRVSMEDLVRHGVCPIKEFNVYIVGLDLMLIDKFNIIVDITEKNYKVVAKKKVKEIMGNRQDYVIKVTGQHTTTLLEEHRFNSGYKQSLCQSLNYDSKDYIKEFENDLVRFLINPSDDNTDSDRIKFMMDPEIAFKSSTDYSGFNVV